MRLLALVVAALCALAGTPAAGKGKPERGPSESPDDETLKLAQEALNASRAALQKGDAAATYRRAADSFRLVPSPEALYLLGRAALLENRLLEAQDLMRRYLADPNLESAADATEQREALRISELPRERSAKLNILGDRGTLIHLDGKLVGMLPLSRPLLISSTEHKVELYRGDRRIEEQVRVPVGRLGELRSDLKTRALLLSILPGVVVLDQYPGLVEVEQRRLEQALEDAVQAERLSPLSRALALEVAGEPEPGPCPDERRCLLELAQKCEADYVLRARVQKQAAGFQMELEIYDVSVAEAAARSERPCESCSLEQAQKSLAALFAPLYGKANARARGQLEVRSEPSEAEVLLDGQRLGKTPYAATVWAGARELLLKKPEHAEERRQLRVSDGETTKLEVKLRLLLPAPLPPPQLPAERYEWRRQRRPLWRLVTGAGTLFVGLLMVGFGGSALGFNGRCVPEERVTGTVCTQIYDTLAPGVGLMVVGPMLLFTGVALMAKPGPRQLVRVAALPTVQGFELALRATY